MPNRIPASEEAARDIQTRQRNGLLQRMLCANTELVTDCELLELALAVPGGGDANALATRLLEQFGTFNKVLHAEDTALQRMAGLGDATIAAFRVFRAVAQRMAKHDIADRPVIDSWLALVNYCTMVSGHKPNEELRVLFLNYNHRLIADEVLHKGTVNHVPVYPREIVKRALEHGAGGVVLVHNHPGGDPAPSGKDIAFTASIIEALATVNISVHDHIIVSPQGYASLSALGYLALPD